jgi:ABC-type multidrug transport system fused ATPase/permease subunit
LGVLDPDLGVVEISGLRPKDAINRWPGAIAYVPQTVALVAGSVRDNVALGLPRDLVDDVLVWDALRRAHLADFLTDNREGLDTAVGERGFRLSGGQRQRLGIARALYTQPKLLVLDEATSALDAESEAIVNANLRRIAKGRTVLSISHRLSMLVEADAILVLERGKVYDLGTHEELLARCDIYRNMWYQQNRHLDPKRQESQVLLRKDPS